MLSSMFIVRKVSDLRAVGVEVGIPVELEIAGSLANHRSGFS